MKKEVLIEHYEKKYEHEKDKTTIEIVPYTKYPANRYEACVKYFVDNFKGDTILELGAGDGIIAKSILYHCPNIKKYVVSDLSLNRLEGIKRNIDDQRVETVQIDVEDFDYNTLPKFDAVIMVALIEHLIDPLGAMKKIKTVLNSNGFVYIDTPNIAMYGYRMKLLVGKFPSTASKNQGNTTYDDKPVTLFDEGHLHYFTYKSLSEMLTRYCGFTKTEKYYQIAGKIYFGKKIHYWLAKIYPEMFSSLVLIAR